MEILDTTTGLKRWLDTQRADGRRIGFVPTMGNLHEGHLALVRAARAACDAVVTSIFVNPMQFGPGEDLEAYPRTPEDDRSLLVREGCHALFMPGVEEIYGADLAQQTRIHVPGVSEGLCGASRPGHFDGVATVVCKLLNLVQPDHAYFGLKDYQQFLVVRKMVADLALPAWKPSVTGTAWHSVPATIISAPSSAHRPRCSIAACANARNSLRTAPATSPVWNRRQRSGSGRQACGRIISPFARPAHSGRPRPGIAIWSSWPPPSSDPRD